MVGRASKIRFGTFGTGLDLARLAWPAEEQVFSSQPLIYRTCSPTDLRSRNLDLRDAFQSFLHGETVDVLLIDLMDDTGWIPQC
jgi:hypothetical protein